MATFALIHGGGGSAWDWWANAGYEESEFEDVFYHDAWPLQAWPETTTRYLLGRADRMFTAGWARRHAQDRLGLEADEMDGGHYVSLSRPIELAACLDGYAGVVR